MLKTDHCEKASYTCYIVLLLVGRKLMGATGATPFIHCRVVKILPPPSFFQARCQLLRAELLPDTWMTTMKFAHTPEALAPDVVYAYTPASNVTVDIDLCGSSYDTKVFVYENAYTRETRSTAMMIFISMHPAELYVSKIEGAVLTGGNTYYIVIDGYDERRLWRLYPYNQ